MGSGVYLKRAIEKYGIEHFKKEYLVFYPNAEMMIQGEMEYVTEEFVRRADTYNAKTGGDGYLIKGTEPHSRLCESHKKRYLHLTKEQKLKLINHLEYARSKIDREYQIQRAIDGNNESWVNNRDNRLDTLSRALTTPEHRSKMSIIGKMVQSRPEVKEKQRLAQQLAWTDDRRQEQSKTTKNSFLNPDMRRRHSDGIRSALSTPDAKAKRSYTSTVVGNRPDVREKRSQSVKASLQTPEMRQLLSQLQTEIQSRVEVRERKSMILKLRHQDNPSIRQEIGKKLRGRCAIHHPTTFEIRYIVGDIPDGWVKGMPEHIKKKTSETMKVIQQRADIAKNKSEAIKGRIAICNLELKQTRMIKPDESIPNGWIRGRLKMVLRKQGIGL